MTIKPSSRVLQHMEVFIDEVKQIQSLLMTKRNTLGADSPMFIKSMEAQTTSLAKRIAVVPWIDYQLAERLTGLMCNSCWKEQNLERLADAVNTRLHVSQAAGDTFNAGVQIQKQIASGNMRGSAGIQLQMSNVDGTRSRKPNQHITNYVSFMTDEIADTITSSDISINNKIYVGVDLCALLGIFNPSEASVRHMVATLIALGIPDVEDSSKDKYDIVMAFKAKLAAKKKALGPCAWPYMHIVNYPDDPNDLPDDVFAHAYSTHAPMISPPEISKLASLERSVPLRITHLDVRSEVGHALVGASRGKNQSQPQPMNMMQQMMQMMNMMRTCSGDMFNQRGHEDDPKIDLTDLRPNAKAAVKNRSVSCEGNVARQRSQDNSDSAECLQISPGSHGGMYVSGIKPHGYDVVFVILCIAFVYLLNYIFTLYYATAISRSFKTNNICVCFCLWSLLYM